MSVIIETSIGDFTIDLYTDERPRCCLNFLKLCKIKFYNFSLFHDVQSNLVAQTGDPTATGRGGESIFARMYGEQARFFDMEVSPRIKHTKRGLVSMVNNGSGMHGSQFFITLAENLDYLDGKHTVFGEVAEGFDIIDKLNDTFCGEDNRPHQDIRIYHTVILDDPYDDPENLAIPAMSPGPTQEMLNSDHIPCDADIDEDKGKTEAELAEIEAEKEAKANTQILEMVGDLPSADVAPPENVLFVCKLNPVTTAEDLEIIFSRFGKIVNCDVIKDSKTGESLQYAFIEFDNAGSCESAYFKMDNVLIDDRRIHVDFSQSVSKLKWKGKGEEGKGVDILSSGDAPVYVLKNQQRQDNHYDLVYEEDVTDVTRSNKSKHRRSTDVTISKPNDGRLQREHQGRYGRPELRGGCESGERSRIQERERREQRERYRDRDRGKGQGRERDRDRERVQERERYRSHDRGKREEREGDRSRDRERRETEKNDKGRDRERRERELDRSKQRRNKESYKEEERWRYRSEDKGENQGRRRSLSPEVSRINVERGRESDSEAAEGRGWSRSHSRSKRQLKNHRGESSSDTGSREGMDDSSHRDGRKKKKRRHDDDTESDAEDKNYKSRKSNKMKHKMISDSKEESRSQKQRKKKKKKKSKHDGSGSDID